MISARVHLLHNTLLGGAVTRNETYTEAVLFRGHETFLVSSPPKIVLRDHQLPHDPGATHLPPAEVGNGEGRRVPPPRPCEHRSEEAS